MQVLRIENTAYVFRGLENFVAAMDQYSSSPCHKVTPKKLDRPLRQMSDAVFDHVAKRFTKSRHETLDKINYMHEYGYASEQEEVQAVLLMFRHEF